MTPSQRIVFNALATYTRTVLSIGLTLFSSRWVVNGLGLSDYGLYGVVGALLVFIMFFNTVLGGSIGRYYAYVIGKYNIEPPEECNELTRWFNISVCIHTLLPTFLVAIGYPVGLYCIRHVLSIPEDRISACIMVFTLSVLSAFVNMVSIPFTSFYSAWQRFGELAFWGLLNTVLLFGFAYSLPFFSGDRLVYFATYTTLVMCSITIIQMVRASRQFKACRIIPKLWRNKKQIKEIFAFSGWQLFGCAGGLLRGQGTAIVINLFWGNLVNGSYSIANQLSAQASSLSNAMVTALTPALTSAEGSKQSSKVKTLTFQACKLGTALVLLFAIPLLLEIKQVLLLWLKQVPIFSDKLCTFMILTFIADKLTTGYMPAIMANGKIARYQIVTGTCLLSTVPLVYLFARMGFTPTSVGAAFLIATICSSCSRLYFGKHLIGLEYTEWAFKVLLPLFAVTLVAGTIGYSVTCYAIPSFLRVCCTTLVTSTVILSGSWFFVLTASERSWIRNNIYSIIRKRKLNA